MTQAPLRESETGIVATKGAVDLLVGIRANLRIRFMGNGLPKHENGKKKHNGSKDLLLKGRRKNSHKQ